MANEAHKIKLLVLWDILCKNTDESHALNADEISELLALRGSECVTQNSRSGYSDFVRQRL